MAVRAVLHRDVYAYLENLTQAEKDDFIERLDHVRKAPLAHSEQHVEPGLGLPDLRRFEFGLGPVQIGVFQFDRTTPCIRMLKCRLRRPREWRPPA